MRTVLATNPLPPPARPLSRPRCMQFTLTFPALSRPRMSTFVSRFAKRRDQRLENVTGISYRTNMPTHVPWLLARLGVDSCCYCCRVTSPRPTDQRDDDAGASLRHPTDSHVRRQADSKDESVRDDRSGRTSHRLGAGRCLERKLGSAPPTPGGRCEKPNRPLCGFLIAPGSSIHSTWGSLIPRFEVPAKSGSKRVGHG